MPGPSSPGTGRVWNRNFERAARNVTEPGEAAIMERLRGLRDRYHRAVDDATGGGRGPAPAAYLAGLEPGFDAVRAELNSLLTLNQDAMRRKSQAAAATAPASAVRVFVLTVSSCCVHPVTKTARWCDPLGVGADPGHRPYEASGAVNVSAPGGTTARAKCANRDLRSIVCRSACASCAILRPVASGAAAGGRGDRFPLYDPVVVTNIGGNVTRVNRAAVEGSVRKPPCWGSQSPGLGGSGELGGTVCEAIAWGRPIADDGAASVHRGVAGGTP